MTLLEAVGYFAGAASVEPLKEAGIHAPKPPLQPAVEARIRRWFASIDETDPRIIADVLERCQRDPDSLARYMRMAAAVDSAKGVGGRKSLTPCRSVPSAKSNFFMRGF